MPGEAQYDMRGLNQLVSALSGALSGTAQDGDLHRLLKTEAGQLAWDISEALGPSSADSAVAKAERDMKQFLTTRPAYSNLDEGQQYSSYADFTWLQAGPQFLDGINDEDNQPGASAEDAKVFLRTGQKTGSRGNHYVELGRRGKQRIRRINRTRISKSAFKSVLGEIKNKIGTLRASFAFTASQLIPQKRIPNWIAKHFPSHASGRAIFNDAGLSSPDAPYIEFGSTAAGVENNPVIVEAIRGKVERRKHILADKIKKVFAGYAYDWNTGRVFRRREAQGEEDLAA